MTEAEWLASTDPMAMLAWRRDPRATTGSLGLWWLSDRKFQLFAEAAGCSGCRTLAEGRGAAFWADSVSKCSSCKLAIAKAGILRDVVGNPWRPVDVRCCKYLPEKRCHLGWSCPCWYCRMLTWNGGTVPALVRAIYDDRRFEDMPILADALMDAGCHDEAILQHCRGMERCPKCFDWWDKIKRICDGCDGSGWVPTGPHVRGCWVLDLLLGKE